MTVATTTFSGRAFSVREVTLIREIVRGCWGLSRMELARTVCELLRWRRPNGRLKARECREFLERLDAGGALVLPDKRRGRAVGSVTRVPRTAAGEPGRALLGNVRDVEPLQVELVREPASVCCSGSWWDATTTSGTRSRSAPTCAIWCLRRGRRGRWSAACSSPAGVAHGGPGPLDRLGRADSGAESAARGQQQPLPVAAVGRGEQPCQRRPGARPRAVGGGLAAPLPPRAVAGGDAGGPSPPPRGVATAPRTGSRWAPRAVAVAWTGTAAVPGRRPRRSWFILWSEMRSGGCGSVERCEPSPPPRRSPRSGTVCGGGGRLRCGQSLPLFAGSPADE